MTSQTTRVASGLAFAEAPRWHDDALWWSDMHAGEVCRLTSGGVETRVSRSPWTHRVSAGCRTAAC